MTAMKRTFSIASPSCGAEVPQEGLNPWVKLLLGIAVVLLFIFIGGHLSQHLPGARRMAEVIDERNLRATAIFYTDFEEPFEGSEYIRHSLEYPPRAE
jgi:hypothetical protein